MLPNYQNQNILIVDDNPTNLEVLSETLIRAGFEVSIANDGEGAIEQVEYSPPELILLDVMMPGIDGFETCQQLKSDPMTEEIPIIFMTAMAEAESKVKGLSLGAVDYITKPFQEEEVIARVKIHLNLRQFTKTLAIQNQQLQQEISQRQQAETALFQLTQDLEERVAERSKQLQTAQVKLVQQEKMSTLGQLVAGVAHEINNPVSFIFNNLAPAQEYVSDITHIFSLYRKYLPQPSPELAQELKTTDLTFILEDLPKVINSMQVGAERLHSISLSLRNFSRADTTAKMSINLHEGLDSTLLILRHRLQGKGKRTEIEVIRDYSDLPQVKCYPGQLNQVFMNLLSNAIDALEEALNKNEYFLPIITIRTSLTVTKQVAITIADNGLGINPEIKSHVFEPMFTTKGVNQGTGLGLSITRQIVEEKHGGSITCNSIPGKGAEFVVQIPLN